MGVAATLGLFPEPVGNFLQCVPVENFHTILTHQPDQPPVAQMRQHPAHGFLGEAEVIGNVQTAHWQVELLPSGGIRFHRRT